MKNIAQLLGQRLCEGDVGVEIECEGEGIRITDSLFWCTEKDGSLRGEFPYGAAEFVMARPVGIEHVGVALDSLIEDQKEAKFAFSFRTSVHVHVNVQTLTEPEMLAFLYLCLLVEEPLMNFCGETRKGNRFCLRYSDAEGFDKTLDDLFNRGCNIVHKLQGDKIRYAAINVHALQKYGSIEFRGMRGNMDKGVILPWCETLIHLRNRAKELGSPINVFNRYISMGNADFIAESLGPHSEKFLYDGHQKDVERSFSLTIDLPHIFKGRKEEVAPERVFVAPVARPRAAPLPPAEMDVFLQANEEYMEWLGEGDNAEDDLQGRMEVFIDIFKSVKRSVAAAKREAAEMAEAAALAARQEAFIKELARVNAARVRGRIVPMPAPVMAAPMNWNMVNLNIGEIE